ncbi:MAG: site-2 protease family protein [Sedimentisphaerales bacterium]
MSEKKDIASRNLKNAMFLAAMIGLFIWWVYIDIGRAANVMLGIIGLGAVIFLHELGHFIAGKLCDINVEAFAVGFGPVVFGVKKLKNFLQFRILPTILVKSDDDDKGLLCFRIPLNCKAGETEYQLRIFPVGGFVKLLGQEDIGADKPSKDPRSFLNKPIWKRIMVGVAGVIFNVIVAIVFFIVVFTIGIKMPPAIVGGVVPGMPADKAGLKTGDEIIAVDGKTNIDFADVAMTAALSGRNESVDLKVKHRDGIVEDVEIQPAVSDRGLREFGIYKPDTLEIANVSEPNVLFENFGLKPGDKIVAADGKKVEQYWQFAEVIKNTLKEDISVKVQRAGQSEFAETRFKLGLTLANNYEIKTDTDLGCIYSMVPRLKIAAVTERRVTFTSRLELLLGSFGIIKLDVKPGLELLAGDIIIKVADINNPTFLELRTLTGEYGDKYMPITVLRDREELSGEVKPVKDGDRFVIGILTELDIEHPIVAKTIVVDGIEPLAIPSGAEIISINNGKISNFYDVIRIMKASAGREIKLKYRIANSDKVDSVVFKVPQDEAVGVSSYLANDIPFKPLESLVKARGSVDAVRIGIQKTLMFMVQTYITLKGLIFGTISPKGLMGPVGMIAASSKIIAEREFMIYFYFMGLISACLAVMNFLPLPILDGGLVVMLIIEKIKGSPVHIKVQEWLTYAGLAIIGALFVLITYNDIIRVFFNR